MKYRVGLLVGLGLGFLLAAPQLDAELTFYYPMEEAAGVTANDAQGLIDLTTINTSFNSNSSRGNRFFTHMIGNAGIHLERTGSKYTPPQNQLKLHLKANVGALDAQGNEATTGEEVTKWIDQSPAGNDANRSTPSNASVMRGADLNGVPSITFRGNNGSSIFTTSYLPPAASNLTVFIVAKANPLLWPSSGSSRRVLLGSGSGSGASFSITGTRNDHFRLGFYGRGYSRNDDYSEFTSSGFSDGNGHIAVLEVDVGEQPTGTVFRSWYDGNAASIINGVNNPSIGAVHIGGDSGDGNRRFHGEISEVLIYERLLSDDERDRIGSYLQAKYDLGQANYPPFAFVPNAGLQLWLDANDGDTLQVNSDGTGGMPPSQGEVGRWMDKSGNSNHATVANMKPTYQTGQLAGKPAITFDGVDDRLGFPDVEAQSVFVVTRPAFGNNPDVGMIGHFGNNQGIRRLDQNFWKHPGSAANDFTQPAGSEFFVNSAATNAANELSWHIVHAMRGGSSQTFNSLGGIFGGLEYAGGIAEVLVYDRALTLEEQHQVGFYLADKYNRSTSYQEISVGDDFLDFVDFAGTELGLGLLQLDFTISMWAKRDGFLDKAAGLFEQQSVALNGQGAMWGRIETNGCVSFAIDNGTVQDEVISSSTIRDTKWHLFTFTRDAGQPDGMKIYIDGELDAMGNDSNYTVDGGSTALGDFTGQAFIGTVSGQSFDGIIDDVRVYSQEFLSASAIEDMYFDEAIGAVPRLSLPVEDFSPLLFPTDLSGNLNHGIAVSNAVPDLAEGSYVFPAITDHLRVPHSSSLDFGMDSFTISCWINPVKPLGIPSTDFRGRVIDNRGSGSLGSFAGWQFRIRGLGSGQWTLHGASISDGAGRTAACDGCGPSFDFLEWHHIAMVYSRDFNVLQTYIDGVANTPIAVSANFGNLNNGLDTAIGATLYSSGAPVPPTQGYAGAVQNIRLYGRAVTSAEMTTIFNAGRMAAIDAISEEELRLFYFFSGFPAKSVSWQPCFSNMIYNVQYALPQSITNWSDTINGQDIRTGKYYDPEGLEVPSRLYRLEMIDPRSL